MAGSASTDISKRIMVAVAANKLCEETPLKDITVWDICEKSGVSKSSFYRMFADKFDIAFWCQKFPIENGIGQMGRTLTCFEGISVTFEGLALFKSLFQKAKDPLCLVPLEERGRVVAANMLRDTLSECHGMEMDDTLSFQIEWITKAGADASRWWLDGRLDKSPAEMAELVESCYPDELRGVLNSPVNPLSKERFDLGRLILLAVG